MVLLMTGEALPPYVPPETAKPVAAAKKEEKTEKILSPEEIEKEYLRVMTDLLIVCVSTKLTCTLEPTPRRNYAYYSYLGSQPSRPSLLQQTDSYNYECIQSYLSFARRMPCLLQLELRLR
jgi:hypothetical protein